MMYGVKNQWNASLSIGGKFYPINPSTVPTIQWFENIHQHLPSLNLVLMDKDGTFGSIASTGDGVPIEITLGDGGRSGETSSRFNIQGQPQITHGRGYNLLHINAVLDAVPFLRRVVSGLYEGSSSATLAKVAGQVGLGFSGVSTSDSQVWLPNNKTLAGFVRSVAQHGWIGQGRAVVPAVTDQFKLIYRDITNPLSSGETFASREGGRGVHTILDWEASSLAAQANHNRGYGSTSSFFGADGIFKEFNKVAMTLFNNFLGASSINIDAIGQLGGRLDNMIRPAGNTHEKYEEALHENRRVRSLYASDLKVVTCTASRSELLSKVAASPHNWGSGQSNQSLSGEYILTSRTRSIVRSKYVEMNVLTTSGMAV